MSFKKAKESKPMRFHIGLTYISRKLVLDQLLELTYFYSFLSDQYNRKAPARGLTIADSLIMNCIVVKGRWLKVNWYALRSGWRSFMWLVLDAERTRSESKKGRSRAHTYRCDRLLTEVFVKLMIIRLSSDHGYFDYLFAFPQTPRPSGSRSSRVLSNLVLLHSGLTDQTPNSKLRNCQAMSMDMESNSISPNGF